MDPYGSLWIPMDPYGFLWNPMDSYGFLWIHMVIPIDSYRFLWITIESIGIQAREADERDSLNDPQDR